MEQANRLTLRSVSRPAPAGFGISDFGCGWIGSKAASPGVSLNRLLLNAQYLGGVFRCRSPRAFAFPIRSPMFSAP
jgi:hypothetical protein